ncbi:carboxypeptidase-like regulatory domain-containing protein [Pedobacter caeni]|uniref:Carboxypeptidase regulatory-like domain-containing protein n=1 Tax=Pedobacter caeni TaxID=288992 RepID=A0A1M4ZSN1_9SPHI|nr:carboxypeptidase-like regulatory domain-containing protein [Pedobacter caeni]SHF21014.1 Carboxypeptidase regulatory-like domain-containing protein [Pedobacter caeni]
MLKRAFSLFLFLSLQMALCFGQSRIFGSVSDSTGVSITSASVTIIDQSGAGVVFSGTDDQGRFNIGIPQRADLSIKVSAIGFKPFLLALKNAGGGELFVKLVSNVTRLQEVTIKSGSPVSKSLDTIKYNVSHFRENQDRVIADVIARMPGIQVDEKGGISFNGKRISKVYIDGENLLDRNYKLATENIPAGAVDQLQVIEADQPVKALKGYVRSDDVAINLTLSNTARTIITNTAQLGAGNRAYFGELSSLMFKKKSKAISTFKANNIGLDLLNEMEEVGEPSSAELKLRRSQSYLSMQSEIIPDVQQKYYLMNNDFSGSINPLLSLGRDWTMRLNLSSSQFKRKYRFSNHLAYFLASADTISYDEHQDNTYRQQSWNAKVQLEKNSRNIYFRSQTSLEMPRWKRNGQTTQNDQPFEQRQPAYYHSLSNLTTVVKALGRESLIEYRSLVQHQKNDEQLLISPGIHQQLLNGGAEYLKAAQQVLTEDLVIEQNIALRKKIDQLVISASAGLALEKNRLFSHLGVTGLTGEERLPGPEFRNDIGFQHLELKGNLSALYQFKNGSLNLSLAPGLNLITYQDHVKQVESKQNYFNPNPALSFRMNAGKFSQLQLDYSSATAFGEIKDVYSGLMLVNFRQFNSNDIPLPRTDHQNLSARYAFRRPINMFFYNIELSYLSSKQNYISSFMIDRGLTRAIAIDFDNRMQQYNLGANLSKYVFFIGTNVSFRANLNLQKGNTVYNNEVNPFEAIQLNAGSSLRKKISARISLAVIYDFMQTINHQQSLNQRLETVVERHKVRAEWTHRVNSRLFYQINYSMVNFNQSLQQQTKNEFFDISLRYSPKKIAGSFELQCINVVGQDQYSQSSSNANELSIYAMPLRQRTFLFKYSFNF